MNKVYSLIFLQHCNKTIQDRIMGHPEFETKIKNDPIKLLKAVKILINEPVRARYPYASMTKSITRFMTCKQQENKSLTDYVKRFKSNQDGLAQTMGKDFLKKFIENTRESQDKPDVNEQNAMYDTAYPRWTAYMLMKNSNQGKYGTLMTGLTTQFSVGVNMYPDSVTVVAKRDTMQTNVLKKEKRPKDQWAVKKAMMRAQAKSEKESDDKEDDDNASQTQGSVGSEEGNDARASQIGKGVR
jgi:hypothetical protein